MEWKAQGAPDGIERGGIMSELLPCPFCGGEADIKKWTSTPFAIVVCKTKDCPCSSFGTNCYNNEQEAIEAWNTRTERTCKVLNEEVDDLYETVFTNLSCGHYYNGCKEFVNYCPRCGAKVVNK